MEGALEAALRIAPLILENQPAKQAQPQGSLPKDPATQAWLERFQSSVQARKAEARAVYRDVVQRALSAQDSDSITQRALLQAAATA
jgi:hypothetical protein